MTERAPLRTRQVERCPLCAGVGSAEHRHLVDRLFSVPGSWDVWRCHDCRALWLNPRPVAEDIPLAYSDYYTHEPAPGPGHGERGKGAIAFVHRMQATYARRHFAGQRVRRVRDRLGVLVVSAWAGRRADASHLAAHLVVRPGARLLDVGCGNGTLVASLRALGWDAEGIEPDDDAAAVGRSRGLRVMTGALPSPDLPPAAFGAVTSSHVIEHLDEPDVTLAAAHDLLEPGGALVVITPNAESVLHRVLRRNWLPLDPPRHLVVHSARSLQALLEKAGFVDVRVRTTVRAANVTMAAWLAFRRGTPYDMTTAPPARVRVVSELGQQLLAAVVWARPRRGDELVATARRPGA